MAGSLSAAALGAFLWGLVSVLLSPCHLASIPLLVGYVAGQGRLVEGREAVRYALAFSLGLFVTIGIVGTLCAWLGRMLGDVGPYFPAAVGLALLWVSLDMLGLLPRRAASGPGPARPAVRGTWGALLLGLTYGGLSGTCTFGFIAPLLAVIALQERIAAGVTLIALFALGHCLPIVAAGSCAGLVGRWLEHAAMRRGSVLFRRAAGAGIGLMGVFFVLRALTGG
jgi:cytochrome c-type biogenesis protein